MLFHRSMLVQTCLHGVFVINTNAAKQAPALCVSDARALTTGYPEVSLQISEEMADLYWIGPLLALSVCVYVWHPLSLDSEAALHTLWLGLGLGLLCTTGHRLPCSPVNLRHCQCSPKGTFWAP